MKKTEKSMWKGEDFNGKSNFESSRRYFHPSKQY